MAKLLKNIAYYVHFHILLTEMLHLIISQKKKEINKHQNIQTYNVKNKYFNSFQKCNQNIFYSDHFKTK